MTKRIISSTIPSTIFDGNRTKANAAECFDIIPLLSADKVDMWFYGLLLIVEGGSETLFLVKGFVFYILC